MLPDWDFEPLVIAAIMPHRLIPARTRVFIDFVAAKLKGLDVQIDYP